MTHLLYKVYLHAYFRTKTSSISITFEICITTPVNPRVLDQPAQHDTCSQYSIRPELGLRNAVCGGWKHFWTQQHLICWSGKYRNVLGIWDATFNSKALEYSIGINMAILLPQTNTGTGTLYGALVWSIYVPTQVGSWTCISFSCN